MSSAAGYARAARVQAFRARCLAAAKAMPVDALEQLYRKYHPDNFASFNPFTFKDGRCTGLADKHRVMRWCHVVRAMISKRRGRWSDVRENLVEAKYWRQLERRARAKEASR